MGVCCLRITEGIIPIPTMDAITHKTILLSQLQTTTDNRNDFRHCRINTGAYACDTASFHNFITELPIRTANIQRLLQNRVLCRLRVCVCDLPKKTQPKEKFERGHREWRENRREGRNGFKKKETIFIIVISMANIFETHNTSPKPCANV